MSVIDCSTIVPSSPTFHVPLPADLECASEPTSLAFAAAQRPLAEPVLTSREQLDAVEAPTLVGAGNPVPVVVGGPLSYANFDVAASAPVLTAVRDAVEKVLPYYGSVHRGAGYNSQVSTRLLEASRRGVGEFVGARADDVVLFTRNTTDAANLLAHCLPAGTTVTVFETEHHASLLPWRGHQVVRLAAPASPAAAVADLDAALAAQPAGPKLVCVTGASNVTGEVWPVAELVTVAHRHGARLFLDAAQLAPHRRVDLEALGADWLALSGHKLYAPYGSGALVGRRECLTDASPYLVGGGATAAVGDEVGDVVWAALPERHEAGTPNVVGAVALSAACAALAAADRDALAAHEEALLRHLLDGLATVPGLTELSLWGQDAERIGVATFVIEGIDPGLVAAALSAEYAIGVRDGAFCAHPFVRRLLGAGGGGRAVRASFGLGTTAADVDRLVNALRRIAQAGPRWQYAVVDGRFAPTPDPRALPADLADLL